MRVLDAHDDVVTAEQHRLVAELECAPGGQGVAEASGVVADQARVELRDVELPRERVQMESGLAPERLTDIEDPEVEPWLEEVAPREVPLAILPGLTWKPRKDTSGMNELPCSSLSVTPGRRWR
jgi:hypothetical protein